MAKRITRKSKTVVDTLIPVYIPTEDGYGELELGKASMKVGTLVIEFNTKLPSIAIQNRILRGDIVGVTFVIPEDEAAEAREAEAMREQEARDAADLEILNTDDISPEDLDN